MKLRSRLRAARKRAGLSQAALAKKLGVSAGTVGSWEGKSDSAHGMRIERLAEVAAALGCPVEELVA